MKSIVFLLLSCVAFATTFASTADLFRREDPALLNRRNNPPQNGTCRAIHAGAVFALRVDDLSIAGEIHESASLDQSITMDIDAGGASLLQFSAELTFAGPICYKWHFGDMVGAVRDMTLSVNGNWTTGTVNGIAITPFSPQTSNLTFVNGSRVPDPVIPARLVPALDRVPAALQQLLDNCPVSDSSTLQLRDPFPRFLDSLACTRCTLRISRDLMICGIRCGAQRPTFPNPEGPPVDIPPCGCLPGPAVILQCTRDVFSSPCCPVVCGASEPSPFGFPFRRTSRCCGADETCLVGQCCPASLVRRGICCLTFPDACCEPGTPSRCFADGLQKCVDGVWEFERCEPPRVCTPIPVANAGVFCQGPPTAD